VGGWVRGEGVAPLLKSRPSMQLAGGEKCDFKIPTPLEGEGGGDKTNLSNSTFCLLGNPGIVIQPLKWNCKVTFLNKPWALVRKYLRLAPEV